MQQYRTRIIDADRTLDALIKARTKARRTSGGYRGGPEVRILLLSMVDDAIAEVTASSNLAEQQFQGGPEDLQYDILHQVMKQATWLLGRVPEWEDMQDLYALGKLKLTDVDWELLNILKRSNIFEEDAEYHFQGDPEDLIQEAKDTVNIIKGFFEIITMNRRLLRDATDYSAMHTADSIIIANQRKIRDATGLLHHMVNFASKQGWQDTVGTLKDMIETVSGPIWESQG